MTPIRVVNLPLAYLYSPFRRKNSITPGPRVSMSREFLKTLGNARKMGTGNKKVKKEEKGKTHERRVFISFRQSRRNTR